MAACAKVAFPACTTPLITALGAFDKQRKFVLRLSEKTPPNRPRKIQKVTTAVEGL
jgi:hypothetical protein